MVDPVRHVLLQLPLLALVGWLAFPATAGQDWRWADGGFTPLLMALFGSSLLDAPARDRRIGERARHGAGQVHQPACDRCSSRTGLAARTSPAAGLCEGADHIDGRLHGLPVHAFTGAAVQQLPDRRPVAAWRELSLAGNHAGNGLERPAFYRAYREAPACFIKTNSTPSRSCTMRMNPFVVALSCLWLSACGQPASEPASEHERFQYH